MFMRIICERTLSEAFGIPCEGIFWVIDNKLVTFKDPVNPRNPYDMTDLLHKETWKHIKNSYKVSGKVVPYDYFPRGRVETLVILNSDGKLDHYEANIYLDKCIHTENIMEEIISEYNLYLPNVKVNYCGKLFIDGSHYVCHNCK